MSVFFHHYNDQKEYINRCYEIQLRDEFFPSETIPNMQTHLIKQVYRKNSKNWDTLNYYRDCPTNGIVGFYSAILRSKDADRITKRVDTDQTAP